MNPFDVANDETSLRDLEPTIDGPYVSDRHDFVFLWETVTGCLWARARMSPGIYPDPLIVVAYKPPDIFKG
eukprot:12135479-Alexandrium_andersonii.AAC.1